MTSFAVLALSTVAALACIAGLWASAGQVLFIVSSYRVCGTVATESRFRMYGRELRFYRASFLLAGGQRAELRNAVASSSVRPRVGETVPVLVVEKAGRVKAKIGTASELWFSSALLLFVGLVAGLASRCFA